MNNCNHEWETLKTFNYSGKNVPLTRKCNKCNQMETREYLGGDIWKWTEISNKELTLD
jgi:hypothetical protein